MNLGLRDSPTHVQRGQQLHLVTTETNCHLTQDSPANIHLLLLKCCFIFKECAFWGIIALQSTHFQPNSISKAIFSADTKVIFIFQSCASFLAYVLFTCVMEGHVCRKNHADLVYEMTVPILILRMSRDGP